MSTMRSEVLSSGADSRSDLTGSKGCFLCGQIAKRTIWRERGFEAGECGCGLVCTTRWPNDYEAEETDEMHPPEFYAKPAAYKASWVRRHCVPGRLLEIGCGEGHFLAAVRTLGYEVAGLEPNPVRARSAREKLALEVQERCLANHELPVSSFDVVYHCDLLSHFASPVESLIQMRELLRPGGVLCFEVGLLAGISPFWYHVIGTIGLGPHRWFYSERALKRLLECAGLRVDATQYFGLAPRTLLTRPLNIFCRLLTTFLFLEQNDKATARIERMRQEILCVLRYRIGAFSPRIGPQTVFVVARPK